MNKTTWVLVLVVFCLAAAFSSPAVARKAQVDATLCNTSEKPVEFKFYNAGDTTEGLVSLFKKAVRACSCVNKQTKTNSRIMLPHANVRQMVYRKVESTSGENIKVCVSAEGEFEGYIDAEVSTCVEAKRTRKYLAAPELTYAQGGVKNLETQMHPKQSECVDPPEENPDKCLEYTAKYVFTDGAPCRGNPHG